MFFRNLTLFRFPRSLDLRWLADHIAEFPLNPVGPLELASTGFIPPHGNDSTTLLHKHEGALWLTVGSEQKILPGPVVNAELAKRIEQFEKAQGRTPGSKLRKQMKDDLLQELLPRAMVKPLRLDTFIDTRLGLVAVNTSSRKAAEGLVSSVRTALGSFSALPLNAEVAPRSVMTGWLAGEPLPDGVTLGEACVLKDPSDHGATVRCTGQDLRHDEVQRHLEAGKQVTRLALNVDDCTSFEIGEDVVLRKFRLLDGAIDRLEHTEADDLRAELDARFALMTAELRRVFAVLQPALKLSEVA